MANCHQQFIDFDSCITLNDSRIESLKTSRKRLRDRIRDDFKENHPDDLKPKFWSQGSFHTGTAINPIPYEVEENGQKIKLFKYDVDDGIYFIGEENDRKSVTTYHNWIYDAVNGHTNQEPIDKDTCVRTVFSDGHHIDQPIYFEEEGQIPQLAHKAKSWIDSDPREFSEWFQKKANEYSQLKRLVRYFKAWGDYQNQNNAGKIMPTGLVMTIWVTENAEYNDRDDLAMKDTLRKIKDLTDGQIKLSCLRPTVPKNENLLQNYKYADFFKERLSQFVASANQAINENNQKIACGKWQIHFGDRFSCANAKDKDEKSQSYNSPAIVTSNAKSA